MTTAILCLIAFILGQFVGLFVGWEVGTAVVMNEE